MKERIQKVLAQAGLCSRRAAEEWIRQGRVTIDGRKANLGDQADPGRQIIAVDGKAVDAPEKKIYLMLNKPRGYVSTARDERGRKTVTDLVKDCGARVYPVGRLDYDSEGLLLMTNDGALTLRLTHPRHEIGKTYQVTVRGDLERIPALREPMQIDGKKLTPAEVFILSQQDERTARISMTIYEGRNRQIRKMCEQVGLDVRRLKRIAVGKLSLDRNLAPGKWRLLTDAEISYLQDV